MYVLRKQGLRQPTPAPSAEGVATALHTPGLQARCKRPHIALQKAAKRTVKSRLLQGERPSFAKQTKTTNIMGTVKTPRNTSVELLRFAFMYLILLLHAYIHGTELDYERIYLWGANPGTAPHLALFSLSQIGVTGFMFMSGYFAVNQGVPFISLSYEHKMAGLLESLGETDRMIDITASSTTKRRQTPPAAALKALPPTRRALPPQGRRPKAWPRRASTSS